jgi:hypothetical protein
MKIIGLSAVDGLAGRVPRQKGDTRAVCINLKTGELLGK